jgi:hypothetical protein
MTPWRGPMNNARHGQLGVIGWLRTEVFVSSNSSLGASFEHHPKPPHKHHYQLEHKLRSELRTINQLLKPRYKPRLLLRPYRLIISLPIDVRLATIFAKTVKPFRLRCKAAPTEDCIINQRHSIERAERDTLSAFSQLSSKI